MSTEIKEITELLTHTNPIVRIEALKLLPLAVLGAQTTEAQQSGQTPNIKTFIECAGLRKMLGLIALPADVARCALNAAITFSENDAVSEELLKSGAIGVTMEALDDRKLESVHLNCYMLLCNLTRTEHGAAYFMQEGKAVQTFHARKVLNTLLSSTSSNSVTEDALQLREYIARILLNLSALSSGRAFLMSSTLSSDLTSPPIFSVLSPLLLSSSKDIYSSTLHLFRNLFMTSSHHDQLLRPGFSVLPNILQFVAGDGEVRDDEIHSIPYSVMNLMNAHHNRDTDASIRTCVLDILLLCARNKPSRLILKQNGVYPVVREWHKYEQGSVYGNELIDNGLQDLVPYFLLDEEDSELHSLGQNESNTTEDDHTEVTENSAKMAELD